MTINHLFKYVPRFVELGGNTYLVLEIDNMFILSNIYNGGRWTNAYRDEAEFERYLAREIRDHGRYITESQLLNTKGRIHVTNKYIGGAYATINDITYICSFCYSEGGSRYGVILNKNTWQPESSVMLESDTFRLLDLAYTKNDETILRQ